MGRAICLSVGSPAHGCPPRSWGRRRAGLSVLSLPVVAAMPFVLCRAPYGLAGVAALVGVFLSGCRALGGGGARCARAHALRLRSQPLWSTGQRRWGVGSPPAVLLVLRFASAFSAPPTLWSILFHCVPSRFDVLPILLCAPVSVLSSSQKNRLSPRARRGHVPARACAPRRLLGPFPSACAASRRAARSRFSMVAFPALLPLGSVHKKKEKKTRRKRQQKKPKKESRLLGGSSALAWRAPSLLCHPSKVLSGVWRRRLRILTPDAASSAS